MPEIPKDGRPFSQACENNKAPILRFLKPGFTAARSVLEIGSGTGQHAVHFAAAMPWLDWQVSDRVENHPGIKAWIASSGLPNLHEPLELDVMHEWPAGPFDAVFTANTFHIMTWEEVIALIRGVAGVLAAHGALAVYGPFRVAGGFTSASNAAFDASLRAHDFRMGIRDIESVLQAMSHHGLVLQADFAMPANNRLLFLQKTESFHD